ncbi:MAG: AmmeMemoRadiSam system radical SAM enzyme [Candidatus Aenigmarchaeota archaeon]|nr:AmmeMemoRadiSam system radical SAM enzyme [Candidatus Aenigmarchaeota archaeon]
MKEAMFYKRLVGRKVKCELCPRNCIIPDDKTGICGVRKNSGGKLYSLVYGLPVSVAVDPIEKKPLFHFAPGSTCLSIATVGCNLKCKFCQNFEISQEYGEILGNEMLPEEVIELAKKQGVDGIAYTYTEPTVFYEYALDVMKIAHKEGLYNVWVSNGYTNPEAIRKMAKYLDAVNIDLKGDDEFYRDVCLGVGAGPVYHALKTYREMGIWVEVTNLLIPGYNDSAKKIEGLVDWVLKNLGPDTPLHFSAFYPNYKMSEVRPTPVATLEDAYRIAKEKGLYWVYIGNVWGHKYESTYCWKCGTKLVDRAGFTVSSIKEECPKCGEPLSVRGLKWMKSNK